MPRPSTKRRRRKPVPPDARYQVRPTWGAFTIFDRATGELGNDHADRADAEDEAEHLNERYDRAMPLTPMPTKLPSQKQREEIIQATLDCVSMLLEKAMINGVGTSTRLESEPLDFRKASSSPNGNPITNPRIVVEVTTLPPTEQPSGIKL